MTSRLLSDAQLRDIAEPLSEKALRALAARDVVMLKGLLLEMLQGPAGVEGLTLHVLSRFVGEIRKDFGEEGARRLLERVGRHMMRSFAADWNAGREREVIVDLLSVFKHQGGSNVVPVTETDQDVVFDLAPCGSGGRSALDGTMRKWPEWYGAWRDGASSFCQACKACQRAFGEAVGEDAWTTEISDVVPGRCTMRFRKRTSRGTRLFPGADAYVVTKTNIQLAIEKTARHDLDIAELVRDQHRDWLPWHDFGIALAAYLFATCYLERGTEYLAEKLATGYTSTFRLFYPVFTKLSDEANLRYLCKTHHYHQMSFTLTEEDDRFVFRLDPCGSGGRLLRGQMWRNLFQYGGELSPLVAEAHDVTFGRGRFPVYCTHCGAHNRDQFDEDVLYFVNDGHAQLRPGMPCLQFTYKKGVHVDRVDRALLKQVGCSGSDSLTRSILAK